MDHTETNVRWDEGDDEQSVREDLNEPIQKPFQPSQDTLRGRLLLIYLSTSSRTEASSARSLFVFPILYESELEAVTMSLARSSMTLSKSDARR